MYKLKTLTVPFGLALALLLLPPGCSRKNTAEPLTLVKLTEQICDLERIARLDIPCARLASSYDRAGGNNDFNFVLRRENGWAVLADLKGPGYVSRFWFTGADDGKQPLRFFFDNEKNPRIDTTLDEFCGRKAPFLPLLAAYEPFCWYSFVPLPYSKRLVIMTKEGGYKPDGGPKLFFQVNYCALPKRTNIESFPEILSAAESNALIRTADKMMAISLPSGLQTTNNAVLIQPGQSAELLCPAGPAVIRELRITPDMASVTNALKRDEIMFNTLLRIYWDNKSDRIMETGRPRPASERPGGRPAPTKTEALAAQPSVEVPLGNFFGSFRQMRRFAGAYFGCTNQTFYSRFPMPFASAARIEIKNDMDIPLSFSISCAIEPLAARTNSYGYFHSGWTKSGPQDLGRPHRILKTKGQGHLAGCILAVASLDRSWWLLEGDDTMRIDNEAFPRWHGTGLEDYFNAGWYYGNALVRPFHGLLMKAPYQTIQYRIHQTDPVAFEKEIDFEFERGPDHASHGYMESVSFYYLSSPARADSDLQTNIPRPPPNDELEPVSVMMALNDLERLHDFGGAADYIDAFLEKYANYPYASVLRLRKIAYEEKEKGFAAVRGRYERFRASETNEMAGRMAETLLWLRENPANALLGVYCNMRTGIFMDGKFIGEAGNPERMIFFKLQLPPGKHALALQSVHCNYPFWVQACLRTRAGDIYTSPRWKFAYAPSGNWSSPEYDDSGWETIGGIEESKGPPVDPFVWLEPHAFVEMQSKARGIWVTNEWKDKNEKAVFRTTFEIP